MSEREDEMQRVWYIFIRNYVFFNSEYNNNHDPSLPHKVKLRLLFFTVLTEGGRAAKTVTNMDSPFPSKVAVWYLQNIFQGFLYIVIYSTVYAEISVVVE